MAEEIPSEFQFDDYGARLPSKGAATGNYRYRLSRPAGGQPPLILSRSQLLEGGKEGNAEHIDIDHRLLRALRLLLAAKYRSQKSPEHFTDVVSHEDLLTVQGIHTPDASALYKPIQLIRDALHDRDPPELIKNRSREGYYFVPDVEPITRPNSSLILSPHSEKHKQAFREFFGDGAWSEARDDPRGVIVLQFDTLAKLIEGWTSTQAINGNSRSFKARRWVNVFDADGAKFVLELFHSHSIGAPRIVFSSRNAAPQFQGPVPFVITMGGHTLSARSEIHRIGQGWMGIRDTREQDEIDSGDTLCLHRKLLSDHSLFTVDEHAEMPRILPSDWMNWDEEGGYIEQWTKGLTDPYAPPVQDYAMILRNTRDLEDDGRGFRKTVEYYLIGFSEIGTAAAAYYLQHEWYEVLWKDHVKGRTEDESRGDFFVIIEGPSHPGKFDLWKKVKGLSAKGIWDAFKDDDQALKKLRCPWIERYRKSSESQQGT